MKPTKIRRDDSSVHSVEFGRWIRVSTSVSLRTGLWEPAELAWGTNGQQSTEAAEQFMAEMSAAIAYAKALNAERAGKPAKEPA